MWSLGIALIIGLTIVMASTEGFAEPDVPSGKGPYSVGAVSLLELDDSRHHQNGTARPVPVVIFYPADVESATEADAVRYPRNPFVNATTQVFLSTNFEARGIDRVFNGMPPAPDGPFPALVFSPGARAPYWYNIGLAARVAGHGFVVALLGHYGEAAYANPAPSDPLLHVAQRGLDRILDMRLAIDRLLMRSSDPADMLYGVIDPARIAVGGHSFGGLTAVQLVGGDDLVCDTYAAANPPASACVPFTDVDLRVKAAVFVDSSTQAMKYGELERIAVPGILIGEDFDSILAGFAGTIPPSLHARAHHAISGEPTYRVDLTTSRHVPSFTNACQSALVRGDIGVLSPAQVAAELNRLECQNPALVPYAEANGAVWRYTIAFLKAHLSGDSAYAFMLTPGWAVAQEPFVMFFVKETKNGLTPVAEFPDDTWFHQLQPNPDLEDQSAAVEGS